MRSLFAETDSIVTSGRTTKIVGVLLLAFVNGGFFVWWGATHYERERMMVPLTSRVQIALRQHLQILQEAHPTGTPGYFSIRRILLEEGRRIESLRSLFTRAVMDVVVLRQIGRNSDAPRFPTMDRSHATTNARPNQRWGERIVPGKESPGVSSYLAS